MEIHNGDADGFNEAVRRIVNAPHPAHLLEYYAIFGESAPMETLVRQSMEATEIAGYSLCGEESLACGVSFGEERRMVWMVTTKNARRYPRWMLKEMRTILGFSKDFYAGRILSFFQMIPLGYVEGLHFVRRLGFESKELRYQPKSGHYFYPVEMRLGEDHGSGRPH